MTSIIQGVQLDRRNFDTPLIYEMGGQIRLIFKGIKVRCLRFVIKLWDACPYAPRIVGLTLHAYSPTVRDSLRRPLVTKENP